MMRYTTDLVEVCVPEGCSVVLVLSENSEENLDLTESSALLLDSAFRNDDSLMGIVDDSVQKGDSFIESSNEDDSVTDPSADDTVKIGEIVFPEEITVYVKGVKLNHNLAGTSLAKSLEDAIRAYTA